MEAAYHTKNETNVEEVDITEAPLRGNPQDEQQLSH